jgi:ribosomal protein S18 acetylase RimI-like enzyme
MENMIKVFLANPLQHVLQIREIFWEYLEWANNEIIAAYQVSFDIQSILEQNMRNLQPFLPPNGRLLLCQPETRPAGVACLKPLSPTIGEIKRMYVRPEHRQQGVGKALMRKLLEEAEQIGYECLRLDSARFMTAAHHLYRSFGFWEIEPYEGSEVPLEFQKNWIFMER